jgi:ABC-type phosphate transport system substrate-binding protein
MKRKAITMFLRPHLLGLALLSILLAACGSPVAPEITGTQTQAPGDSLPPTSRSDQIQINGAGATFPLPIYSEWTYTYSFVDPSVVIIYNIKPPKDYPVDIQVPALILDRQTLVDIYNGVVNRWNDPRIIALNDQRTDFLPDAAITVIYRSDASGTTELFTRALVSFSPDWTAGSASSVEWPVASVSNGAGARGNQGVAEAVINTVNSLGYVELSYAISN